MFFLSRLQVLIFRSYIRYTRTILMGIQVVMSDNQCTGVSLVQCLQQLSQGGLLRVGARIGWSSSNIQPSLVANAYRVLVVMLAVGTHHPFRSACLNDSVTTDDVVVADAEVETSLAMPRIYLGG